MEINIKNMVSKSCVLFVKDILNKLNIKFVKVELGVIITKEKLSYYQLEELNAKIKVAGLEIFECEKDKISEKIKHTIIDYVYNIEDQPYINFSDLLSERLGYTYNYLSNLFVQENKITIKKYMIKIKIERVKELLMLGDHTLTEISHRLHYSSCAHLSNQFKKVTGISPSDATKLLQNRKPLHNILQE